MRKTKNIFLIGPMGAGKTSIGRMLAKKLNMSFYDSDQIIEEQTGANITWIFDIEGEVGFRAREMKIIDHFTQKQGIVLATGGGAILNPINRRNLSTRGIVIYLSVSIQEQLSRTSWNKNRPLLVNKNPKEILEKLRSEREVLYQEIADYIVNTHEESLHSIVKKIIENIELAEK